MSLLGKQGLKQVAKLNYDKAHYAADQISKLKGFEVVDLGAFFNEFVVRTPKPVSELNSLLLDYDILGGYDLSNDYPELENHMLLAVTEMNTKDDIDYLVEILQEVTND
jgi:glycine dehydrogenase subunit 1